MSLVKKEKKNKLSFHTSFVVDCDHQGKDPPAKNELSLDEAGDRGPPQRPTSSENLPEGATVNGHSEPSTLQHVQRRKRS